MTRVLLCLAVLAALALAGCGEGESTGQASEKTPPQAQSPAAAPEPAPVAEQEPKPDPAQSPAAPPARKKGLPLLEITIDGYPNADYGGLYLAERRGYFADVGLAIHVHTPLEPSRPIRYVAEKVVPLAVSHQPEVALAQARGTPIVAVGSWLPHSTTALIWLRRSGIDGVADLEGKTIATEGLEYQEKFLQAILARENLSLDDVEVIRPRYQMIPALKGGRADAAIGGSWNVEGIELRQEGFDPVVAPVSKLGVPDFEELVLIARKDQLAANRDMIRRFLSALTRGAEAAIAHPGAAVEAIKAAYPEVNVRAAARGVAVTSALLSRDHRMAGARWHDLDAWMVDQGLLEESRPVSQLLTNAYLP